MITRYSKTQAMYLSRKGQLPPIVDVFGSGEESIEIGDESGIFESSSEVDEIESEQEDDVDDMFSSNDSDEELTPEPEPIAEPTRTRHDDFEDDDDGDIDSFFG